MLAEIPAAQLPGPARDVEVRRGLRDRGMESDNLKGMQIAYIGMGSNLASHAGSPGATLAAAAERLEALGQVVGRSSLYSTEPVGFAEQPRFINAIVVLNTDLTARDLLLGLLRIEQEFGRDRSRAIRNGPRTLDLDILVYGDEQISEPGLEIPHPRMEEREFVIIPMAEIASNDPKADTPEIIRRLLRKSLHRSPGYSNAVVPLQSDIWHASRPGDAGSAGES